MSEQPIAAWLTPELESQWLLANRRTPVNVSCSMMAFNIAGVVALMLLKAKCKNTDRGRAQLQHGIAALLHSIGMAAAAFYLLNKQPPSCLDNAFCFSTLSNYLLDIQAGYLLYEVMFYYNFINTTEPTFPFPGLHVQTMHHVIALAVFVIFKVYPCTLTIHLLAWHLILGLTNSIDALKEMALALQARQSVKVTFMHLLAPTMLVKACGALALAIYTRTYVVDHKLGELKLNNDRDVLTVPYVWIIVICSWLYTALCFWWLSVAVDISQRIGAELTRIQAVLNKAPARGSGAVAGNNKKAKKKVRRA